MFNNTFRGPIPDAFGNLKDLIALYLDENELSGQIPTSLGQMTSIIDLRCVICYFRVAAREIMTPHFFMYCPFNSSPVCVALLLVRLRHNRLNGTIPTELGDLNQLAVGQINTKNCSHNVHRTNLTDCILFALQS
jgi:hypothetical protein